MFFQKELWAIQHNYNKKTRNVNIYIFDADLRDSVHLLQGVVLELCVWERVWTAALYCFV